MSPPSSWTPSGYCGSLMIVLLRCLLGYTPVIWETPPCRRRSPYPHSSSEGACVVLAAEPLACQSDDTLMSLRQSGVIAAGFVRTSSRTLRVRVRLASGADTI